MLIDTHAHVYLERFDDDRDAVIQRAREAGVTHVGLPAIDVDSVRKAVDLCDRYEGLFAMAALHPSETQDATEEDFAVIERLAVDPHVLAIGESGLDYYWDRSFDEKQHHFLRLHARLAIETGLPLILHTRDKQGRTEVFEDVLAILHDERERSGRPDRLRGIFHCFSADAAIAARILDFGFLLGIGGTLTFKNSGVAEAIRHVPLEHVVLETDAPFLAPVPHRGKRNEPAYVRLVAEELARLRGIPRTEVARITTRNAKRLFGLG